MSRSCDECYWNWCQLIGCQYAKRGCVCEYYYPNDLDEEFQAKEPEYNVAPEGTWAQMGFILSKQPIDEW